MRPAQPVLKAVRSFILRRAFLMALALMVLSCFSAAFGTAGAEQGEWRMISEHVTPLITSGTAGSEGLKSAGSDGLKNDLGHMVYRTYSRPAKVGTIDVIIAEGSGPGPFRAAQNPTYTEGRLFDADGEYSVISVAGQPAVLEIHPLLPASLAVSAGDGLTITLESSSVSTDDLTALAETIIYEFAEKGKNETSR